MGEIHGLLLPVARRGQRTARRPEKSEKANLPGPLFSLGFADPSTKPPSQEKEQEKRLVQTSLGGLGEVELERRKGFGERRCPEKQEGESLSFQPPASPARREITSSAGYVQPPRQGPLAWATEGQPHPACPSSLPPNPHPSCPGSPPEGERGPGEESNQRDCPAALRLRLRRGRGGPARGGLG